MKKFRKLSKKLKKLRPILLVLLAILAIFIVYTYFIKKPSNDRNWEVGFEILPKIEIDGSKVTVENVRDWRYKDKDITSKKYINETYDASRIKQTWFLVEPFAKWDGIAHTFFLFEFDDGKSVSVSVESRREKGEDFSAFMGLFNNFELIYLWGSEEDLIGRRLIVEQSKVYKYPLTIPKSWQSNLFVELAKETEELYDHPRFYNTLINNCTNILAKSANRIKKNVVPLHISWAFPGYSDDLLYKLKFIPTDKSLEELKKESLITEVSEN